MLHNFVVTEVYQKADFHVKICFYFLNHHEFQRTSHKTLTHMYETERKGLLFGSYWAFIMSRVDTGPELPNCRHFQYHMWMGYLLIKND